MTSDLRRPLTRTEASTAVEAIGWRYLLGALGACVRVRTIADGLRATSVVVAACGDDADSHLRVNLRPDRLEATLQTRAVGAVTARDVELARRVTAALAANGLATGGAGSSATGSISTSR